MRWILVVVATLAVAALGTSPSQALAPCHHGCHLSQGTPILLPQRKAVWVRQCNQGGTCVFERLDFEGRVQETITDFDKYDFDDSIDGTKVVRLDHQAPWKNLAKPFVVPLEGRALTLKLAGRSLTCQRPHYRTKVAVPCAKAPFVVRWASIGEDSKPEDPSGLAAIVVTCGGAETTVICN